MKRKCSVCGEELSIIVNEDSAYSSRYYFGKINVPIGKGEWKKTGVSRILGKSTDVVEWTGREKQIEYWECEKCYVGD